MNNFKSKISSILWGLVVIAMGVIFGLNALGITHINIFFGGWWAVLFIIIPCTISLFTNTDKIGSLVGIAIGVVLLLACQDFLDFGVVWKIIVPVVIIGVGLSIVFSGLFSKKEFSLPKDVNAKRHYAVFSGKDIAFNGEEFTSVSLTAVFGGIELDLRNAIINKDCFVECTAVFGGIDIILPPNVNVKVCSNCVFGGVDSDKANYNKENAVTVYVNAKCIFGGAEVK